MNKSFLYVITLFILTACGGESGSVYTEESIQTDNSKNISTQDVSVDVDREVK